MKSRIAAIIDARSGDRSIVESITHHRGYFAALIVVVDQPPADVRGQVSDHLRAGAPVVMIETPASIDLETITENLFRHLPVDFGVVLTATDRLVPPPSRRPSTAIDERSEGAVVGSRGLHSVPLIPNPHIGDTLDRPAGMDFVRVRGSRLAGIRRWLGSPNAMKRAIDKVARAASRTRDTGHEAEPRRDSGVLGPDYHAERHYLDLPPFGYVWDRFTPTSVLDLGCGLGGYLLFFSSLGAREVVGVDGFERSHQYLGGGEYLTRDLREPLDLGRRFDLVVCTEVVEHVAERYGELVIDSIARHARETILFSAARPGQPGEGHVNCRPIAHWIAEWAERGWEPAIFDSLAVRSLASFHWFRRNLLVLQRIGQDQQPGFSMDDLDCLECRRVLWTDQEPGVLRHSLSRGLPPLIGD